MKVNGHAHVFKDHVNTDEIIPARYLNSSDPAELAKHVMEDADADFPKKAKPGDLIVAGVDFGCGSSREHAPIAIKAAGISCVIAKSFARIFFRNAINIGLPIIESSEAAEGIASGDEVRVDFAAGTVTDVTKNKTWPIRPFPKFMQGIMSAGGLMPYIVESVKLKA
jgi:3-isopropylmalate dehydratase small subunit